MLKVTYLPFRTKSRHSFYFLSSVPITFFAEPVQYAEIHSTVLIKCRVLANPAAEISWFKGRDKTRLLSSNYERTNDGLKINRVSLADNDVFWCQADVLETGESKDYPIQVIIARKNQRTWSISTKIQYLIGTRFLRAYNNTKNSLCITVCCWKTNSDIDMWSSRNATSTIYLVLWCSGSSYIVECYIEICYSREYIDY